MGTVLVRDYEINAISTVGNSNIYSGLAMSKVRAHFALEEYIFTYCQHQRFSNHDALETMFPTPPTSTASRTALLWCLQRPQNLPLTHPSPPQSPHELTFPQTYLASLPLRLLQNDAQLPRHQRQQSSRHRYR